MAKDLKIKWDTSLMGGDFSVKNGDLESDSSLETAVIISLFTDKRASDDDPLLDERNQDRRGWWGDLISPDVQGDEIGSKLWLLDREKTVPGIFEKVKKYINDALQWLIEDGVASNVEVIVERQGTPGNDNLAFQVTIYKTDGREIALNYTTQWSNS